MKRIALTLAAVLALAPLALAHNGVEHLRGTVTQISAKSITIQTQEKQTKTIALLSDTTFDKSGAAAALKDVKVGDRVVVDVVMKGKEMTAKAVKFGAASPHK
jgi:hypothetical protein